MEKMCAITAAGADGEIVYPDVDDVTELKGGTVVFATVTLTKIADSTETAVYALPGITYVEGGKMFIRPCPTKLWDQGWAEIKTVALEDTTRLRFCSRVKELDEDQLISDFYEDETGEAVESCGDKLLKDSGSFSKWMGGSTKSPTFNMQRWSFLRAIVEHMAKTMSIADWNQKRPTIFDQDKEVGVAKDRGVIWLDTDFITPTLDSLTSGMQLESDKKKFKTEVCPQKETVAKYLTLLVDIMTSDEGPSPSSSKKKGVNKPSDLMALTSQVVDLKAVVTTLTGTINAIATQLKVRADSKKDPSAAKLAKPAKADDPKAAEPQAVIVDVSGSEHECAYHVMSVAKAVSDGTTQPSEKPTFSDMAVDAAREALMLQAKLAHEKDAVAFEALMDTNIEELYKQVTEEDQGEKTWPGEPHFVLHAVEHPNVDLKLKTFRAGKLCTISTRQVHLPPAKLVMFANWRPGHYDIMGVEHAGATKIAFTKEEAGAAELVLDALLTKGQAPTVSKLSKKEFISAVRASLVANRASKKAAADGPGSGPAPASGCASVSASTPAPASGSAPGAAPAAAPGSSLGPGSGPGKSGRASKSVRWGPNQVNQIVIPDSDTDDDQRAVAASLVSFAQEEMVKRMQAQMEAQSKQMQAQAQLSLQSRQQVAALEAQLQAQVAGGQHQGGKAAANNAKPQKQPAHTVTAVQQQGTSPLDMILNGSAGGKPGVQTALVIWTDAGKKKMEQALRKLDAVAFKTVNSMTKIDAGTPNARFIVLAFAQDVPMAQQLVVPLTAAGMRAEYHDPVAPSSPASWSQVVTGSNKPKGAKKSKLAGQAQTGLSTAIAKAGLAGTAKRVHGQCDYFSAKLKCPRDSACRFTCYNGPGAP